MRARHQTASGQTHIPTSSLGVFAVTHSLNPLCGWLATSFPSPGKWLLWPCHPPPSPRSRVSFLTLLFWYFSSPCFCVCLLRPLLWHTPISFCLRVLFLTPLPWPLSISLCSGVPSWALTSPSIPPALSPPWRLLNSSPPPSLVVCLACPLTLLCRGDAVPRLRALLCLRSPLPPGLPVGLTRRSFCRNSALHISRHPLAHTLCSTDAGLRLFTLCPLSGPVSQATTLASHMLGSCSD